MKRLKWILTGCELAVLLTVSGNARSGAQDPVKPTYTRSEYNDYLAAYLENDPVNKIKLLDSFVGKYPMSSLLEEAHQDYYQTYYARRNYLKSIEYADKLLGLGDKVEPGLRLQALTARALAISLTVEMSRCKRPRLTRRQEMWLDRVGRRRMNEKYRRT